MTSIISSLQDSQAIRLAALSDQGQEQGHIFLYLIKNDLHNEPYGLLEDLFVEEEYRHRGVATNLIKEVIAKGKELGCYKLIGTSRDSRCLVHQMYLKLGFVDYGKEFRMDLK